MPRDITFVHAANAIAAYEAKDFRATNSPFDQFLAGNPRALSWRQKKGMLLFYGKAGCSRCHSGALQTDHGYHAVAMPQIGPVDLSKGEVEALIAFLHALTDPASLDLRSTVPTYVPSGLPLAD